MAKLKNFYVRNVDAWKKTLLRKKFSDKKLEVQVVEHGIVLPARLVPNKNLVYEGGVCDNDFNFIAGFSRNDPAELNRNDAKERLDWTCKSSYSVDRKDLVNLDEDVIFGGALNGHFGHFIVESWSRLWFVVQNPDLKSKILFILTRDGYKPWFDEFFRLMGIDKERIVYVDKPFQCRSVTVPEQSQYNPWDAVKFTKEFFLPYQAIKSKVTPGAKKKLYLTRTKFDANDDGRQPRHCFNEKYFEDFFVERGFESVALEELPVEEQISLITGADEIAAILGTLTHWAMFCKPSVKFTMLNRTENPHSFQMFVNEAFNIENYYIVDASKSFMYARHDNGIFLLGSNKYWTEFVADYFGEQISDDDDNPYLEKSLNDYIRRWCKHYQDRKYMNIWVDSLVGMCHRIIELERETSKNRPSLDYQTHIANKGWSTWSREGMVSNPLEQKLDIQAIKLDFSKPFHAVHYAVHDEKDGWSNEVEAPEMAGTTGQRKPITGMKIRLDEAGAEEFDILYRVHKFDGEWTPWAQNGEELLSGGAQLNAIQIKLKPKLKVKPQ